MERELDKRDSIRAVTKNSFITAEGLSGISSNARKMLYLIISQCRKNDSGFYEYKISMTEFSKIIGVSTNNLYQKEKHKHESEKFAEVDRIQDDLIKLVIKVPVESKTGKICYTRYTVFSKASYCDGSFYMKLNSDMTDLLLGLKGDFTQPLLQDFMRMRSKYGIPVWHLMQRDMHSKKPSPTEKICFRLSLQELRKVTGTEDKLLRISNFRACCLDQAIKDIETYCGVKITYEPYPRTNAKGKKPKTEGFDFTVMDQVYIPPFTTEEAERYKKSHQQRKERNAK